MMKRRREDTHTLDAFAAAVKRQAMEVGQGMRGIGGGGGGGDRGGGNNASVDAVKQGQRCSKDFKEAWHHFCQVNSQRRLERGGVTYDPARYDSEFIKSFFDTLGGAYTGLFGAGGAKIPQAPARGGKLFDPAALPNTRPQRSQARFDPNASRGGKGGAQKPLPAGRGRRPEIKMPKPEDFQVLVELVKSGQENDDEWVIMWDDYCAEFGGGVDDPASHQPMFVIAFVFKYGMTRLVSQDWAGEYLQTFAEVSQNYFVKTIKNGQPQCSDFKVQWEEYCEEKMGGTRDPMRHEASSLLEFMDTVAIPEFGAEPFMEPFQTGDWKN